MIYYDNEARRLFARERIELLQDEMQAARHACSANLGALVLGSLALPARALRMRREPQREAAEASAIIAIPAASSVAGTAAEHVHPGGIA
jgi:hypothetical protein